MTKPLPEPLYCCENDECCEEHTWPAEDLWWSDNLQGFFCESCWDCDDYIERDKGISLAEELKQRGLTR